MQGLVKNTKRNVKSFNEQYKVVFLMDSADIGRTKLVIMDICIPPMSQNVLLNRQTRYKKNWKLLKFKTHYVGQDL